MKDESAAIEMNKLQIFLYHLWGKWWLARTIFSKRFWLEPFKDYPQTWYFMPHWKIFSLPLQYLCGLICNHEPSKTEWGYGGGEYCDTWCRWCDKLLKINKESARFMFPNFNEMRPDKKGSKYFIEE
jgi:hypothetical protein